MLHAGGTALALGTLFGNAAGQAVGPTVYVGSDDGYVYALDAADGTQLWTFETGSRVEASPTVVNGTVYVGSSDEYVYALDATDGTQQWAFQTGSAVFSSPTVVENPASGDSIGSRVRLGTLGHHGERDLSGESGDYSIPDTEDSSDEDSDGTSDSEDSTDEGNDGTSDSEGSSEDGGGGTSDNEGSSTDGDDGSSYSERSNDDDSDGSGPGFGLGAALNGLGGAGYLLKQRFDDETGSE